MPPTSYSHSINHREPPNFHSITHTKTLSSNIHSFVHSFVLFWFGFFFTRSFAHVTTTTHHLGLFNHGNVCFEEFSTIRFGGREFHGCRIFNHLFACMNRLVVMWDMNEMQLSKPTTPRELRKHQPWNEHNLEKPDLVHKNTVRMQQDLESEWPYHIV